MEDRDARIKEAKLMNQIVTVALEAHMQGLSLNEFVSMCGDSYQNADAILSELEETEGEDTDV